MNMEEKKSSSKFCDRNLAVIYLRNASYHQAEDGYGLNAQKSASECFCKEHGWTVVAVFEDPVTSDR